ncbi:MAG: hypothetical protein OXD01_06175 [Gammaproteobacteria bacterium]|nr:hypothetical protein [Gammaproteobacteria bacterium]
MSDTVMQESVSTVRFEPDQSPPAKLTLGLSLQLALLTLAGIVLTPAIIVRMAGASENYLNWAVFTAVLVSGASTIIQAKRVARIGAGYVLAMGTSGAFIAVCVTALIEGGPEVLASLIIASSLFQFLLAGRLSLLRRILTPVVSGTVIMLIPVSVMPVIWELLTDIPAQSDPGLASVCALVTLLVVVLIALRAKGTLRLWALMAGVVAGSLVAGGLGLYDVQRVQQAAWLGLPAISWPGISLQPEPVFWALLPSFVFVTLIGAIETIGDSVAIQRVSWRRPRAVDFRAVQGAVSADGLGNLLSGLAGTVPNTTYSNSVAVVELTGVASRRVGVALGSLFILAAFSPKLLAAILAIPGPVVAAYTLVLLAMLFVLGMKIIVQNGINYRDSIIVGVSFWLGVGCQGGLIYPEIIAGLAGGLLQNGMTAGGLCAIIMNVFLLVSAPRQHQIEVPLTIAKLPQIREFLESFVTENQFNTLVQSRLEIASEETLLTLINSNETEAERKLQVTVYRDGSHAVLEFVASPGGENIQNLLSVIRDSSAVSSVGKNVSLRLLQHAATSINHQQYHNMDIVTLKVEGV